MNATTVAVDLAKSVFQLAVADEHWRVVETQRLTRTPFERWFANRDVSLVVMESCGSAHHWARWLNKLGIELKLLPAQYVRTTQSAKSAACAAGHWICRPEAIRTRPLARWQISWRGFATPRSGTRRRLTKARGSTRRSAGRVL